MNSLLLIIDSTQKVIDLESIYGLKNIKNKKELLLLCIIRKLLNDSSWYELPVTDIQYLKSAYAKLLRNNSCFVFDFPENTIYSNINEPQTSYTFDQILV